jgi:hypothetical protein
LLPEGGFRINPEALRYRHFKIVANSLAIINADAFSDYCFCA